MISASRILRWAGIALLVCSAPASNGQAQEKPAAVPEGIKLVEQMPGGAPPRAHKFPQAATRTLANGLRVYVVQNAEQPAVSVRLVLTAAGDVRDPAGRVGVASLAANLLTKGTATRSAAQIAETIDFVGGTLTASAGSDSTSVTSSVVKKDLGVAMDLLSDIVLHAAYQQEEIDRELQQELSGLRIQYSDPEYLATVLFNRVVYGEHPYGLPGEGTPDSLTKVRRENLLAYRDAYYVPNHALLAFAGDITPEAAFALAEKYLGGWQSKEVPAATFPAPKSVVGQRILLVDKPDAVQTQIRVGRLGIRRNDGDYIPLAVTDRIFGGGFNSRLSTEVRQKKGLTYGAYSRLDARKDFGSYVAGTSTRTEATLEATRLIVTLLDQMAKAGATPKELDFATVYLAGVYPIQTETAEQVADRVLNAVQYALPADYNETYPERIRGVSAEQVKAMAGRYFDAANLDLVLVGNVAAFRDALKKDFVGAQIAEIPFDQVDVLSADLRRAQEKGAASTPEAVERGKEVMTAAAAAAGGAALAKISSFEYAANGQLFTPQQNLPLDMTVKVVYPNRARSDVSLAGVAIAQGYDGNVSWLAAQGNVTEFPANLNAEQQRTIDLSGGWGLLRQFLAGKVPVVYAGEEEVQGKKLQMVEWASLAGKVALYFDPASKLFVGARYRETNPQGSWETLQMWDDFRVVPAESAAGISGAKFPYLWTTFRDGQKFTERSVTGIKLNTKPDPAIFAKPQQ